MKSWISFPSKVRPLIKNLLNDFKLPLPMMCLQCIKKFIGTIVE